MDFIAQDIRKYAEAHTEKESDLLKLLNRDTYANVLKPRMLSGHLQGRVLSMFSKMIKPKYILEIGTYTGYSALCLAEGLVPGGKLITIDTNEELEDLVTAYIKKAGLASVIEQQIGHALDIIPTLDHAWDMVFIDADKANYSNYYDLIIDKVMQGGFIIADNVLWSGKVVGDGDNGDAETLALRAFNKKVHEDIRVENTLMPLRDGLMILRKK